MEWNEARLDEAKFKQSMKWIVWNNHIDALFGHQNMHQHLKHEQCQMIILEHPPFLKINVSVCIKTFHFQCSTWSCFGSSLYFVHLFTGLSMSCIWHLHLHFFVFVFLLCICCIFYCSTCSTAGFVSCRMTNHPAVSQIFSAIIQGWAFCCQCHKLNSWMVVGDSNINAVRIYFCNSDGFFIVGIF